MLEIACFSIESCLMAQNAGAHRIEFCTNYESGGLTPSFDHILKVRDQIHIPLHVIIRFSTNSFIADHLKEMQNAITFCRENHVDGVVFGSLNKKNEVDIETCEILLEKVGSMHCTFHRDIDKCEDLEGNVQKLINLGFNSVLSSGGKANALEGATNLAGLQSKFGYQIEVIAGGGIRPNNIAQIIKRTQCGTYHSAALDENSKNVDPQMIEDLLLAINS